MRISVVLFNLGGPDSPEAVKPFLFNLFNDKAIIGAPQPIRWLLATLISTRRAPVAREIYGHLGGRSPLVPETEAQAAGLKARLEADGDSVQVVIAMRYWHPRADQALAQVQAFEPERIVLLPLYPQFSTATTGSSVAEWVGLARAAGLAVPTVTVCCWPTEPAFVAATAAPIAGAAARVRDVAGGKAPRLLFSAHGLPKRVVDRGDPYQWQVERTVDAVVAALGEIAADHAVCYQSRVGPLEWIGPSTEAEIERAGADGVPVVLIPIAFVSEHSETLVELDIEYKELAERHGVPGWARVPTQSADPAFLDALAGLVRGALDRPAGTVGADDGQRICPGRWSQCPCRLAAPDAGAEAA